MVSLIRPYCWWFRDPARKPVVVGSLSHDLPRVFIHPRWLFRISSINSRCIHLFYKVAHVDETQRSVQSSPKQRISSRSAVKIERSCEGNVKETNYSICPVILECPVSPKAGAKGKAPSGFTFFLGSQVHNPGVVLGCPVGSERING